MLLEPLELSPALPPPAEHPASAVAATAVAATAAMRNIDRLVTVIGVPFCGCARVEGVVDAFCETGIPSL
ncbi:hypothetical protein GCM10009617_30370 [Leifsonia poae]|uniref:Uncharacterized protein n=1 Tax=Leifsonia poae TaxID=110933 RepID=A0A9W6HA63_9MICO|nr:hypothetical protein GCM10017584_19490 [Leifsonia poae]